MNFKKMIVVVFSLLIFLSSCSADKESLPAKIISLSLEPSTGNPRNSEGDFIKLNDGRILFVYSHYTDGTADDATAYLAGRYSLDFGKTWSKNDLTILPNEGDKNIMSVSLLRLNEKRIALFYLRKNNDSDCILYMRTSDNEAESWSEAVRCIPDSGYFVVNNDRVVRLKSNRLVFPVSLHKTPNSASTNIGTIRCYYSDDNGNTWNRGEDSFNPDRATTQEPGIIELNNGSLMLYCRTESGMQYTANSLDQGVSWSALKPSNIKSPLSPASIERIPQTGDLMLVWNNNYKPIRDGGSRTPFNLAISKDEGKTWENIKTIESNPNGWYCYTAIEFIGDDVLLGHCAGDRSKNVGLSTTHITRLNLDWIYGETTANPTIITDGGSLVELNCSDKNAKIYYSINREYPNKLYTFPIKVSRTTPLWVVAKVKGKSDSELITAYVGTNILQPSLKTIVNKGDGTSYTYYEGSVKQVKEIENLKVKTKGIADNFNIKSRMTDTSFAFVYKGFIEIPEDGKYTFYLSSNDGSILIIDDNELINNDGGHGMEEKFSHVSLQKGKHKIELKYFQMLGGQGLKVSWEGANFKKEEIPKSVLSF